MDAITHGPDEGERFVRDNRIVTIKLDLPQLSIHEIDFDPSFEVAPHVHDHVDALYVLDGEVELTDGDTAFRVGPGTLHAAPPGTRHGFRNPGPGRARIVVFHAPDGGFADLVRGS